MLLAWVISNTVVAIGIATLAIGVRRWTKNVALSHLLWVMVLVKLVTPPLVEIPVSISEQRLSWFGELPAAVTSLFQKTVNDKAVYQDVPGLEPESTAEPVLFTIGQAIGMKAESRTPSAGTRDHSRTELKESTRAKADNPESKIAKTTSIGSAGGVLQKIGHVVMAVWLSGSVLIAAWIVLSALRIRHLVRNCGHLDCEATMLAASVMRQADIQNASAFKSAPPVWLVDAVVSPMLVGSGRRIKILFPAELWNRLDVRSRGALIRHEIEHFHRSDMAIRYLEGLAMILAWWHPLVWLARTRIEDAEEHCCDLAASVHTTPSTTTAVPSQRHTAKRNPEAAAKPSRSAARVYAESILATIDFLSESRRASRSSIGLRPVASGIGPLRQIETRIVQLLSRLRSDGQSNNESGRIESRLREIMSAKRYVSPVRRLRLTYLIACLLVVGIHPTVRIVDVTTNHNSQRSMPSPPSSKTDVMELNPLPINLFTRSSR